MGRESWIKSALVELIEDNPDSEWKMRELTERIYEGKPELAYALSNNGFSIRRVLKTIDLPDTFRIITEQRTYRDPTASSLLPGRGGGRLTPQRAEQYEADVIAFCDKLKEIDETLGFKVSARGWCYILEEHGLRKGDFDICQKMIGKCRKEGYLPLDFTADDERRSADNIRPSPLQHRILGHRRIPQWQRYRRRHFGPE